MPARGTTPLAVLFVEDSDTDAKLVMHELRRSGYAPHYERVETAADLENALRKRRWNVVISDSSVPRLRPLDALTVTRRLAPDVPFIVVSGTSSPQAAAEILRSGAADYVEKGELHRLGPAVARELARASPIEVREDERRRIARQLHDQISQVLVGASLKLELAGSQRGAQKARTLAEARELVSEALDGLRNFSLDLSPAVLDEGVVPALEWLIRRRAPALRVELDVEGAADLPRSVAITCFRIVEEALTNAARHAGARRASVRLRRAAGSVEISVADDGKGFAPRPGRGLGIKFMRERVESAGGTLEIVSGPGRGTTVTARLPLPAEVP